MAECVWLTWSERCFLHANGFVVLPRYGDKAKGDDATAVRVFVRPGVPWCTLPIEVQRMLNSGPE